MRNWHMSTSVQTLASTGFIPQWTIGDRLRKAREMTGLTQVQFAERVGLSRATVNNSELNKSQPRKSVVLLWAMETGVDRDWLMTGSANNETPDPDGPGGRAPAVGFEPTTVRLSAWSQCYLFVSFAPELG